MVIGLPPSLDFLLRGLTNPLVQLSTALSGTLPEAQASAQRRNVYPGLRTPPGLKPLLFQGVQVPIQFVYTSNKVAKSVFPAPP